MCMNCGCGEPDTRHHPTDITHAYRRFLINQLRKAHGFDGTPIKLIFRAHSGKRQGQG